MKNRETQIFLEAQLAFHCLPSMPVRTKDAAPPGVRLAVGASELRWRTRWKSRRGQMPFLLFAKGVEAEIAFAFSTLDSK